MENFYENVSVSENFFKVEEKAEESKNDKDDTKESKSPDLTE